MRLALLLVLLVSTLAAGCVNPYESGGSTEVDCEPTTNQSQLDEGAPNPILCEAVDEGNASSEDESSSPR